MAADMAMVAPELVSGLEFFPDLDFSRGMEQFRQGFDARLAPPLPDALRAVSCAERRLPGLPGEPEVRVLHYVPPGAAADPRPAVLHIHGGGYVLGAPDMNDAGNRALALAHDCEVVSVDYRLAPEAIWRGSLADNHAALIWLAARPEVDPARIALAGESAGGGHAAMLALHAREAGGPQACFMLLDAPMLDDRTGTAADPHPHTGRFVWTPEKNRFGWGALLGMAPGGTEVGGAPVPSRAASLAGLPTCFISVGALDLFLEEDMEWTRRLTRAGVAVELHVIPGAYHGFGIAQASPQALALQQWRRAALSRAFRQP